MMLTRTVALILGTAFFACGGGADHDPEADTAPLLTFDTARVRIVSSRDTIPLVVELAKTNEQRTMGLMERTHMADSAGMLFIYDVMQPSNAGFWMFRTKIPLDIAFADSTGVIRAIRNMVPCTTATAAQCETYEPGARYQYALEVNSGFFGRMQLGTGDRILLSEMLRKK